MSPHQHRGPVLLRFLGAEDTLQFRPEFNPAPVDPAANRTQRHIQNRGDLFVLQIVHFFHHQSGAIFFGNFGKSLLHKPFSVGNMHVMPGGRRRSFIFRVLPSCFPNGVDGCGHTVGFSAGADGHIQGDPEEPRVKRGVPTERPQFLKRLQECILREITGLLRRPGDVNKRPIQAMLVTVHQQPERLGLAAETASDQRLI